MLTMFIIRRRAKSSMEDLHDKESSGLPAATADSPRASIAARIERLPICGFQRRFVSLISIGSWYEIFDLFIIAYLGAALQAEHFLTLRQFELLIGAGFIGMFIGTNLGGMAADAFGRRTAFITMLAGYSALALVSAFAPNANALILLRFVIGIGIGGQLVIVDTYISEMVPRSTRGRYVAFNQFASFTSVPVAALLTSLLVPTHWLMEGWRWVLALAGTGVFAAIVLLVRMRESPRWLESVGREDEAALLMDEIERRVMRQTGRPLPPAPDLPVERVVRMPFRELWSPRYRTRTILLSCFQLLQTVGFYGFANWAPTFLLHTGRNIGQSLNLGFVFALMNPVGPLFGMLTTERVERKNSLIALSLLIAGTGMLFAVVHQWALIALVGALLTMFSSWFSSIFHAYQAELFPTRARATGVGFTYGWSRISTVLSTLIIGDLLSHGILAVFLFIASAMVLAAILIALWGPRANDLPLEEISV